MENITAEAIKKKLDLLQNSSDVPREKNTQVNLPAVKNAGKTLKKLIRNFPTHDNLDEIYLKVVAINSLYSTNIYDTYKIAYHIKERVKNIDFRLERGDLTLVHEIASGHHIENKDGKEKVFYSFATKYCSCHNPEHYAIYDTLIQDILIKDYNVGKSPKERINYEKLRSYENFMNVISDFKHRHNLNEVSLKDIDMYLWIKGKEKEMEKSNSFD